MMRKVLIPITIVMLLTCILKADERKIAITFDDLPIVFQGRYDKETQIKIFNDILHTLEKYRVKAAGFVVGRKVKKQYHRDLLKKFTAHGHRIGNHSYSHFDLNRTDVNTYVEDIVRGSKTVAPYINGVEYYRYPLLHRGNSVEKREAVYEYLKKRGIKIAHVSIDNDEYAFNVPAYRAWKANDSDALKDTGKKYIEHMLSRLDFYEQLSEKKIGRSMKHVLLLHMNLLNSLFLGDLLEEMRKRGWKFITMEEAVKDPVYSLKDSYSGPKGVGWLERLTD